MESRVAAAVERLLIMGRRFAVDTIVARPQRGQGLVEYALIIALVSILLVLALSLMKNQVGLVFDTITNKLASSTSS